MKKVISNEKLYEKILESVNLLCNAVSSTLGPCGNNVLINEDDKSPYITNDGVTIAKSIESNDKIINTILDIVKEASLKTNEEVGDGTTTTLVLLQSIINDSIKEIMSGKNAFILKNELNITLNKIINELQRLKIKPNKKQLLEVACTSANDKEIGKIVYEVFSKIKSKYAIKIEENNELETYYRINKGYILDIDNIPNIFFTKEKEIILNNVNIFIIRGYLQNLEQISDIINEGLERNKNILILSSDYDENVYEQIILYKIKENKNIYLFKTPDYASRKIDIEEDISFLTNTIIKNIDYENIEWKDCGLCNILINKENITIINNNDNLKNRINELKKQLNKNISDYDKEFIENRISYLSSGIAYIYVGGYTKTHIKEKIMRFEDAVNAIYNAKDAIAYGEGITYLKLAETLDNNILSERIIKNALQKPFIKIFENAGLNYDNIKHDIEKSCYNKIYNFETSKLENTNTTNIIDPLIVEIKAIKNAISIASILITTNHLIINEKFENKKIDF